MEGGDRREKGREERVAYQVGYNEWGLKENKESSD